MVSVKQSEVDERKTRRYEHGLIKILKFNNIPCHKIKFLPT